MRKLAEYGELGDSDCDRRKGIPQGQSPLVCESRVAKRNLGAIGRHEPKTYSVKPSIKTLSACDALASL